MDGSVLRNIGTEKLPTVRIVAFCRSVTRGIVISASLTRLYSCKFESATFGIMYKYRGCCHGSISGEKIITHCFFKLNTESAINRTMAISKVIVGTVHRASKDEALRGIFHISVLYDDV